MKPFGRFSRLIVGLAFAVACGGPKVAPQYAVISVPASLEFNTIPDFSSVPMQLPITNTGSAMLKINSTQITSNPNNVFSVSNGPGNGVTFQIAPGAVGNLTVVMNALAAPGPQEAYLQIVSNASNSPMLTVSLLGTIGSPDAGPMDGGLEDAGPIDAGPVDAGPMDAGTADAGLDAGAPDSGSDAGSPDSGVDAGHEDAGHEDAGHEDAGHEDAGHHDAGHGEDAGNADAGSDAGNPDAGLDAGPQDAGPLDAGPGLADASCMDGEVSCSGQCTDLMTNFDHCGACSHFCQTNSQQGCVGGNCVTCDPTSGYILLATAPPDAGLIGDIKVDQTSVYWVDEIGPNIAKVGLDGGTVTTLVQSSGSFGDPTYFNDVWMAINANYIFFSSDAPSSVFETTLDGSNLVTLGTSADWPGKIAVTPSSIYWVASTTGDVWVSGFASGSAAQIVTGPGSSGSQFQILGTDATYVYWLAMPPSPSAHAGAVLRAELNGANPETLISGLTFPRDGVVYNGNLYWDDAADYTVLTAPAGGGAPTTLAWGLNGPRNMVTDGTNLYWSAGGTDGSQMNCDSYIQAVSITGGPLMDLVEGQYSAWAVAVDQSYVYWGEISTPTTS